MPRIKFIDARFFDTDISTIEEQLRTFLKRFRKQKLTGGLIEEGTSPDDPAFDEFGDELMNGFDLSVTDNRRIRRRAAALVQRRGQNTGLTHLKPDEVKRLSVLKDRAIIIPPRNEAWADELAATLHGEMPWMAPATEAAWHALRRSVQRGDAGLRLPPLLLNGPAGIGKSVWARRLAELCAVPSCVIEVGSGSAGWRVCGLERGWASASPGRPLETILETRIANPVMVVDELCKMQVHISEKGNTFSMASTLLALLEPATNKSWECPYFRVRFDMSHISWVMTANDAHLISAPLLNRCTLIELNRVGLADLCNFARIQAERRGLSEVSAEVIVETLVSPEARRKVISLRSVIRMIETAEVLEGKPRLQ